MMGSHAVNERVQEGVYGKELRKVSAVDGAEALKRRGL